tara:strand:+ start:688 stop:876 length:189 start_codon:yes stop_codon:yes gene_type:complete
MCDSKFISDKSTNTTSNKKRKRRNAVCDTILERRNNDFEYIDRHTSLICGKKVKIDSIKNMN